ncbi:hypothetical protein RvY_18989-1 [Ramazzottius varieornatus]|uniref:Uncharacterized protein n=1 Tax=Ramazzottius varieornatus TaxID=947166 RepID=A0A1D1WBD7_RAMVA|nr:hypothetical protein RvY_18989-1 [Ramazzottius varieornatus]
MVFPLHNFQPGRSTGFWMTFEFLPTCQNAVAGGESHQITGRLRDLPALPHPSLSSSPVSPLYPSASVYRACRKTSSCLIITFIALVVCLASSVTVSGHLSQSISR